MQEANDEMNHKIPLFASEILVASANSNKILELQTVAGRYGLNLLSPLVLSREQNLGPLPEVEETGETYQENALLKAKAFSEWSGLPSLGDDSGLEVAALGNRPGVKSARYAGAGASDSEKIDKLLQEFKQLTAENTVLDRSAHFVCHLVLYYPSGAVLTEHASLQGKVLNYRQGNKGFGYDPIILIDNLGKTLAEIDFELTCKYGFRAKAAEKMFNRLLGLKDKH